MDVMLVHFVRVYIFGTVCIPLFSTEKLKKITIFIIPDNNFAQNMSKLVLKISSQPKISTQSGVIYSARQI